MSVALTDGLKYRYAGRTWATTPYNIVKEVEVSISEDEVKQFETVVYTLPKEWLRNSAIAFNEFKKDTQGQSGMTSFAFFIEMVYRMHKTKGERDGRNFASFLEWVKDETGKKIVGIRVFVFSKRGGNTAFDVVDEMIKENADLYSKNKKWKLVNEMDHDKWRSITSYNDYCRQVADVYYNSHAATSSLDDDDMSQENATHPHQVFGYESTGFELPNAHPSQKTSDMYTEGGSTFKFPNESCIYRIMPSDFHADKFFQKYLPDYFFMRIKFPDAIIYPTIYEPERNTFDVYVQNTPVRARYDQLLDELAESRVNDTWSFVYQDATTDLKEKVVEMLSPHFLVYDDNNDDDPSSNAVTGTRSWLKIRSKMSRDRFQRDSMTADAKPIVSPIIETILTNKYGLNDTDILRIQAQNRLHYCKDRRKFQEDMVNEFTERVWNDPGADVSAPSKKILLWKNTMRTPDMVHSEYLKYDDNMSIFANRTIRVLDWFAKTLFVSKAHKNLFLLNTIKLDAYREEPNLHFNVVFTGEGATSKSFLFAKTISLSIEGTIEELTYQTTRSDAVDGDQNDRITVFHEAPQGLFGLNNHGKMDPAVAAASAALKETLTSGVSKCKEWMRDEQTGERKNRIAKSQQIGILMGATNDDKSTAEEAMQTRFYWGDFEKYENNQSMDLQLCMRGDRELKDCLVTTSLLQTMQEYFKEEQMRVWLAYKLIYMKIIHPPNLKAADTVYTQMSGMLSKRYKVSIPPRTRERYEILCKVLTIINAIETVFNVKGGYHACKHEMNGDQRVPVVDNDHTLPNEFSPMQMLDIEPYLICTEEIAIFSFTHISEEFVNPGEYKVLRSIWDIHKQSNKFREKVVASDDGRRQVTNEYTYIRLKSGAQLLTEISNNMPISSGKMSRHNIMSIINSFKERCLDSPIYDESKQMPPEQRCYNDGQPEPTAIMEKSLAIVADHEYTYLHIDLFDDIRHKKYVNVIKESVRSLEHKYAVDWRKYILGCSMRTEEGVVSYPGVFDTIDLERSERTITLKNPLYADSTTRRINGLTELDEKQQYMNEQIRKDLTFYATVKHAETMRAEDKGEFIKTYLEIGRKHSAIAEPFDYPQAVIHDINVRNRTAATDSVSYDTSLDEIAQIQPPAKRSRRA